MKARCSKLCVYCTVLMVPSKQYNLGGGEQHNNTARLVIHRLTVWSLDVLCGFLWVLSVYSGLLPLFKDMHVLG